MIEKPNHLQQQLHQHGQHIKWKISNKQQNNRNTQKNRITFIALISHYQNHSPAFWWPCVVGNVNEGD